MQSDVVYNASNNELVRTQTLVKSAIIQVDAAPFRQWYLQHYGVEIGRKKKSATKKEGVEEGEAAVVEEVKKSQHVLRKLEKCKEEQKLDSHIKKAVWWCLVRDVALSFRSSVSSILLKLRKAEGTSGESIDALAKVDIVKQRMEAAYETLQGAEFANVRKQFEVLEDRLEEMLQPRLSEALSLSAHTHSDWKKPR
ncbi:hypothetical protein IFM89_028972 [Coptis chinensis]|uniref:40S ribosomal protein S8 n=1 Tax=Coptis chinensis TaxID=261450 RepID=A0A835MA16_9MAGN|nr:hypothetical protein IFM89_028972 [Coptis chinensis]